MALEVEKEVKITINGDEVQLTSDVFELARCFIQEERRNGVKRSDPISGYNAARVQEIENFMRHFWDSI